MDPNKSLGTWCFGPEQKFGDLGLISGMKHVVQRRVRGYGAGVVVEGQPWQSYSGRMDVCRVTGTPLSGDQLQLLPVWYTSV